MFTKFSQNIHVLRQSHYLSLSEMAMIIKLKSKGSLSTLENAKNPPSFETLINIANVFAVKLDWLVGRSSQPYDEDVIQKLELQLMNIKITDDTEFKSILPDIYFDVEKRKIYYSLAERANLIFLLQYLKTLVLKEPYILQSREYSNSTLNIILEDAGIKKNRKKEAAYRYNFIVSGIEKILQNKTRQLWNWGNPKPAEQLPKPLFDITKLPEN